MRNKILVLLITLLLAPAGWISSLAAGEKQDCRKLAAPLSGEDRKYSVNAEIYEFMAFPDIACAVYWRNNELCATELSAFQFSAKVFDYISGTEVLMAEAYFVVQVPGERHPLAFAERQAAADFIARHGGGELLDYDQLLAYPFE